jgi:hypothetical protein
MTISIASIAIYGSYNDLVQNLYSDSDTKPTGCIAEKACETLIKKSNAFNHGFFVRLN